MKNLSLRSKMVLGGILIALIPLTIAGAVTFIKSSRELEDVSKVQAMQLAQSLSSMVELSLEKNLVILGSIANDPQIVQGVLRHESDRLNRILADLYTKIGIDYEGLSIFDTEGIIRYDGADTTRIGISVAERDYFQMVRQGKPGIGLVTASKATGKPIFGLCAPMVTKDGRFLGAVLGVIKTDFLMRYISSLKIGQTGYAFMLDPSGLVIAHPNQDYILKMNARNEEGLAEIVSIMLSRTSGTGEYTYQGIKRLIGFSQVEPTGWRIGVTQHKEEVMALAYANRDLTLAVSGFSLLLTVLALFFLSGKISAPVQKSLITLNQAIEQATEAIFIIGLDRRVQYVNPAMATIVDRSAHDLVGKFPNLENNELNGSDEIWKQLNKGLVWSGSIQGARKDSRNFAITMTITPVWDDNGHISSFLGIGRDITRELMMEAQLRQSQKMEAIGTLAGGIAHDFNNILSAVIGYSELTLAYLKDDEKPRLYSAEILKAAERARELVNRILIFSRQSEHQKQLITPKHIIMDTLKLLRASLPSTIEIVDEVKSDSFLLADPTQIHQIIMNLCTNAGYAMKARSGILKVTLDDFEADEEFAMRHQEIKPGQYLKLAIFDSGDGIPDEIVDRIFDPFFTTKPQGEGTGLGLSVVHGIVKSMEGLITASSQAGKGTTFTVYLPVTTLNVPRDDEPTPRQDVPGGSERVLLVDDEEALVKVGKTILEDLGYKVSAFTNSTDALTHFTKDPLAFDAIVTDYTMPQITGCELAGKIREIRPDVPVILCSGYLDENVEMKIRNAAINEFIRKPITRVELAKAMRRIFDKQQQTA